MLQIIRWTKRSLTKSSNVFHKPPKYKHAIQNDQILMDKLTRMTSEQQVKNTELEALIEDLSFNGEIEAKYKKTFSYTDVVKSTKLDEHSSALRTKLNSASSAKNDSWIQRILQNEYDQCGWSKDRVASIRKRYELKVLNKKLRNHGMTMITPKLSDYKEKQFELGGFFCLGLNNLSTAPRIKFEQCSNYESPDTNDFHEAGLDKISINYLDSLVQKHGELKLYLQEFNLPDVVETEIQYQCHKLNYRGQLREIATSKEELQTMFPRFRKLENEGTFLFTDRVGESLARDLLKLVLIFIIYSWLDVDFRIGLEPKIRGESKESKSTESASQKKFPFTHRSTWEYGIWDK